MNSIRERIIREVIRRIEVKTFDNVSFDKIIRGEIPDDYAGKQGSILAVLEGTEVLGKTGNSVTLSDLELFLSFAVPPAANEEAATVSNNVAGELIKVLSGQHTMLEGGDGAPLSCMVSPISVQPNRMGDTDECATGMVEFRVQFRTAQYDPFAARA